ncbi:hypothetical protein E1258_08725 [Micromonospora sp. KC207]|nr:hypothetical protein E1258_08725 [Micromonospora sp. KC207]
MSANQPSTLTAATLDQVSYYYYYYEAFADPTAQARNDAQRSYAGQYLRRLRRLRERDRHATTVPEA